MTDLDGRTLALLTGESMWPDRINRRWPGAVFIARGRFDRTGWTLPHAFATLSTPAIWGVLIALPFGAGEFGTPIAVTTDLGDTYDAQIDPGEVLAGDSESVVAAARYWELPWRYVGALRDAVAATGIEIVDEDPRDDAVAPADQAG